MIKKLLPGEHEEVTPDVLIPYSAAADRSRLEESAITLITVRPETNKVNYEAAIIKSVAPYADVVYLANLCGNLINDKAIIACHYSSQLQFAINGKAEMTRYPEMLRAFEEKFNEDFAVARILGAFEAILDYHIRDDAESLFRTMVPVEDFLEMYGQNIKKIDQYYVLNYDIPAIITRHHEHTAMFTIALRMKDSFVNFSDIHHLIYEKMRQNKNTTLLGPDERQKLPLEWYDQVRRTYHISRSHIEAMFDLTDYVFKNETQRINFIDTPLGSRLVTRGIIPQDQLEESLIRLKENPLVYLQNESGRNKLTDIIHEGKSVEGDSQSSLDECCDIFSRIDWSTVRTLRDSWE